MGSSAQLERVLLDLRREYLRSLETPPDEDAGSEALLRVRAGGLGLLLRLCDLREIVRVPERVPLPGRAGRSLAPVRGRLLAVADLGAVALGRASMFGPKARLCTLRADDQAGVLVESVIDVARGADQDVARALGEGGPGAALRGPMPGGERLVDGARLATLVLQGGA